MTANVNPVPSVVEIALATHETLRELDPARFSSTRAPALVETVRSLRERLRALTDAEGDTEADTDPAPADTPDVLDEGGAHGLRGDLRLAHLADALEHPPTTSDTADWVAFRVSVGPAYEDLVAALSETGHRVPSLRPTNYARNVFHVASALFALFVIEAFPELMPWIAGGFFASAFLMESSRRVSPRANEILMRAFGKVAHPYERHRINSASWYAAALVLLATFLPPEACAVGVMVLGLSDPTAAFVGRRFGRTRLLGGRSLEGSLAFASVGSAISIAVLAGLHGVALGSSALAAIAAGVSGAIAEVVSGPLDDNFTIPVASAGAAAAVLHVLA